jgi:glycosyltransferase involved in cell wall biosynthesis
MKIDLCMIVKDEEHCIGNCLNSAEKFVDDIIIVDTGSKDNTIKICKKYTDKIYNFKWNNNFSDARNYSIRKSDSDWILLLVADEKLRFSKKSIELLQKIQNI